MTCTIHVSVKFQTLFSQSDFSDSRVLLKGLREGRNCAFWPLKTQNHIFFKEEGGGWHFIDPMGCTSPSCPPPLINSTQIHVTLFFVLDFLMCISHYFQSFCHFFGSIADACLDEHSVDVEQHKKIWSKLEQEIWNILTYGD